MVDPLDATTDLRPLTNAAATDFTQNVDAADAGLTSTQLPLAISHGLQSSPLNTLPPELRNKIWEMVMVNPKGLNFSGQTAAIACPQITWALSLIATCRQIRSETKYLLLDLNDINIHIDPFFLDFLGREEMFNIQRSIALLERIPSSLGREMCRVVLCLDFGSRSYTQAGVLKDPEFHLSLIKFEQAIHPSRLFLGLGFCFSGWGRGDMQVCARDAPVTLDDCTSIRCNVPFGDRALALRAVDETIDHRLGLLQRHGPHRWCAVRAMTRTLGSGLEVTRQYMREVFDLVIGNPGARELALNLQQWELELTS